MSNRYMVYSINMSMYTIFYLLAICDPACENGGTCIEPNTCECVDGYSGTQCQTGV